METPTNNTQVLGPDARIGSDCLDASRAQVVSVIDGVLYVVHGENETVLTSGDTLTIPAGEPRRIWNAGDEAARIALAGAACPERALSLAA